MYRRWIRPWWPARTLLALVLPFAGLLVFGAVSALAASNLVGNPGFESPVAGTQYEGTISPNFGNWIAYSFRHSIPLPSEVQAPSPVHGGSASGEIVNPVGVGSAVFVQDIQAFDPNSTYTFSGWVYPVAGEQYFTLGFGWDRGSAGRTTGGSGINITPTATEFSAWQQSGSPAPALAYNAWHHIQLVVNSATLTSELYVDGSCQGISPAGQPVPSGSSSTILIGDGSAPPTESHFYWDDVELMSGVQVSGCPGGSPGGLVGEWQGNGNANDSVGTNNGTLIDGGYAAGQSGQAFQLDGTDDYVTIPSTAMSSVVGAISVSAWIKPASLPTSEGFVILSQYDTHDTNTAFNLELLPGGHLEWFVTNSSCDSLRGGARTVETSSGISAGQWARVAGTYNPSTGQMSILVNGVQMATQMTDSASVPSLCRSSAPLRIGAAESLAGDIRDYFDGEIEDVQLYNTDISGGYVAPQVATGSLLSNAVSTNGGLAGGALDKSGQRGHVTFSGVIAPGTTPIARYWFLYSGATGTHVTPAQPFQAFPGGVPTVVSAADSGEITPYSPWTYRLFAEDMNGNVFQGQDVAFVPGNLLNPAGFSGTGGYNLTIVCASPCGVLGAAVGAHGPVTGVAFGDFVITGFEVSTGSIRGGLGKVFPFVNGQPPRGNGGLLIRSGSIALEAAKLDMTPTPGSGWQPFTLNGLVDDYNGPLRNPLHGTVGYEPVMAGTIAGGGVWEACFFSYALGCVPPENGNKQAAGLMSLGAGAAALLAPPGVDLALGVFSVVTGAIAADPADHHIRRTARPLKIRRVSIPAGHGVSARAARSLSQVLNALAQSAAVGQAYLDAIQRYQGATSVGDPSALVQQFRATLKYGHELAARIKVAARIINNQKALLASSPLRRKHQSRSVLIRRLRALHTHGLPRALAAQLGHLGVSKSEIRAAIKRLPSTPPADAASTLGPILDPAFVTQLEILGAGLDVYLGQLERRPIA